MDSEASGRPSRVVLCADDYAMTEGVSRAIDALADAGRLSAASVMVTTTHWPAHGGRARSLRARCAVGLHFNLTLGAPLGPMPRLAPSGRLPTVGEISRHALAGEIDHDEIAAETTRQLAAFTAAVGFPPDHVDGHQHVHALPGIRDGVLAALRALESPKPLIRDPADRISAIARRRTALPKALALSWLARGFGAAARREGLPVNDTFAGVSDFAPAATAREFRRALIGAGRLHVVMCHPGFPDGELAAIDPMTGRRQCEFDLLMSAGGLGTEIWRPQRAADGPPIVWFAAFGQRT